MLSADERAAIKARADAATRGPWEHYEGNHGGGAIRTPNGTAIIAWNNPDGPAIGEFWVAARTDIPALLADSDALRAAVADALAALRTASDEMARWERALSDYLPSYAIAISATREALLPTIARLAAIVEVPPLSHEDEAEEIERRR